MKMNNLLTITLTVGLVAMVGCGGDKKAETAAVETAPAAQVDPTKVGVISGKVAFDGVAPKPAALKMSADAVCASAHTTDVFSEDLVVNADKTLKNVIVRVKDDAGMLVFETPATSPEIDQVGCVYIPHVAAVLVDQKLIVKNGDATLHNVHSIPEKDAEKNIGQPAKGIKSDFTFTAAQHVKFKCDVHSWMSAHVLVVDNPFFAVTGDNGSFSIANVPAGEYTIEAWHETLGVQTAKVTVAAQGTATQDFTFKKM